jgi:hypothetical protein
MSVLVLFYIVLLLRNMAVTVLGTSVSQPCSNK